MRIAIFLLFFITITTSRVALAQDVRVQITAAGPHLNVLVINTSQFTARNITINVLDDSAVSIANLKLPVLDAGTLVPLDVSATSADESDAVEVRVEFVNVIEERITATYPALSM